MERLAGGSALIAGPSSFQATAGRLPTSINSLCARRPPCVCLVCWFFAGRFNLGGNGGRPSATRTPGILPCASVLRGCGRGLSLGVEEQGKNRRGAGGRFAAGVSGNPRGRPRGSVDPRTVILAQLADGDGAAIVTKLVEQAKAGEPWAVRLIVERVLPRYERRVEVDLPRAETAADVGQAIADVIDLAASGELTLEEARGFMVLLEQQRRGIETSELAIRLELLEQDSLEEKKRGRR
jgi:hypothetical protein